MRKCSPNYAKTRSKINDKSMKFRSLWFLVFCEEYNVKIVFYMIRGIINLNKVNQKSMQTRCSKRGCKKHDKCSKMEPEWEPKSRKSRSKTRSEKRCEKEHTCKMGRRHVAGAFLRLIISSRLVFRLVLTSFHVSERLVTSREVVFPVR